MVSGASQHDFHALDSVKDFVKDMEAIKQAVTDRYRGFHILFDYTGFDTVPARELSDWIMDCIRDALSTNEIRCVHSHSEVFEDPSVSPPGFAAVCLLDESHVSAHCYSDKGMLAVDVFTCGGRPDKTYAAAEAIHTAIMTRFPSCKFLGSAVSRFPHTNA